MSHIYIPLNRSDEHVAIPVEALPSTDPKELIRVLVRERVPLEIWLRIAVRPPFILLHPHFPLFACTQIASTLLSTLAIPGSSPMLRIAPIWFSRTQLPSFLPSCTPINPR